MLLLLAGTSPVYWSICVLGGFALLLFVTIRLLERLRLKLLAVAVTIGTVAVFLTFDSLGPQLSAAAGL